MAKILEIGDIMFTACECYNKPLFAQILGRVNDVIFITDLAESIETIDTSSVNTTTIEDLRNSDFNYYGF